jgi:hypothetical protein
MMYIRFETLTLCMIAVKSHKLTMVKMSNVNIQSRGKFEVQ